MVSKVTGIEFLSRTLKEYKDELSFANKSLKLNTQEDVREIVEKIDNTKVIKVLRLEGNTIAPEAAKYLGEALKKHPEIERFIGNDIFTSRLKEEIPLALKSICGAFEHAGARLVELNLSDNAFGPIGLDALVTFFHSSVCFSLHELRMHNNGLGPEGARKLGNAIEKCFENSGGKLKLKVLICGRNRLEYAGCKAISSALKLCGTLEEIQMPQNGIRPDAIEFIAEAIALNKNLKIINLNDNTFRASGGRLMSKSLSQLKQIEYINLGDCLLKSDGALHVVRALVDNKNLKEIILSGNQIDAHTGLDIAKLLLKNRKINSNLSLIDLNANNLGVDVSNEIKDLLKPFGSVLGSFSEDEGSDLSESENDEDADEDEDGDGEEEEEYEDYEDEEGEYEDYEDEDEYEEKEYEDEKVESRFGSMNLQQNLFANLINQTKAAENNYMINLDSFINKPNVDLLRALELNTIDAPKITKLDPIYVLKLLKSASELNPHSNKFITTLLNSYFNNQATNIDTFSSSILVYFGFLKGEDKKFRPVNVDENMEKVLKFCSNENILPTTIRTNVKAFLSLRQTNSDNQKALENCL